MSPVIVHGFARSTWTRTVRMVCVEKEIGYELVPVSYGSEQHGELHPFRRMPILEIDGRMIFETLAITGHLDEAFDGSALQPEMDAERLQMRTWMGVCADYLFRDVVRGIPRDRPATEAEGSAARAALLGAEGMLRGTGFLAGESITLADLYLAPQLANCQEKAPELLGGLKGLSRFMSIMAERESFRLTQP
jgi:glutathione S-transferase